MQYRRFGKTGLEVSVLGFGASSLGGVFKDVEESAAVEAVHAALDMGINFIDTSPFYGLTRSEQVLGKALRGVARDRYILATKVGRYGYKAEDFDFSAGRVLASIDESLARMGVDCIDLIQVHDMEFGDPEQVIGETIPALQRAREQGKVRFIGVTCLPLGLLRRVAEAADVDAVQSYCHYCLNDASLGDVAPAFAALDVGIISSAPLAMGLLTNQGPPSWHPAPRELREACARAAAFCAARGADISRLALQFSVANPALHTNLVSTTKASRIRENVETIAEPLDGDLLAGVLDLLEPVRGMTWPQGRPENNDPAVVASYVEP